MAKIAYVMTVHNIIGNWGEVRVYYTNGRDRKYKPETMPETAREFCITARNCDVERERDRVCNTYYN